MSAGCIHPYSSRLLRGKCSFCPPRFEKITSKSDGEWKCCCTFAAAEFAPIKCAVRESAFRKTISHESVIKVRNSPNFSLHCKRKYRSNVRYSNDTFYRSSLWYVRESNWAEHGNGQWRIRAPGPVGPHYCQSYSVEHPLVCHTYCYIFLCKLRGPAWAVCSYRIGPPAWVIISQ